MLTIDVLLPAHGDAPFISETILSVLPQLSSHDKLIVICDRLSESAMKVLDDFASLDSRLQYYKCEESGIVAALNFGIDKSVAQLIARIDSDDIMVEGRLDFQKEFLSLHPEYDLVGSQMLLIDEFGNYLGSTKYPRTHRGIKRKLTYQNAIGHPSTMFRREAVLNVGGYREDFQGAEDYDLWFRLVRCGKARNLDFKFTKYRIGPHQYTKKLKGPRQRKLEGIIRIQNSATKLGIGEFKIPSLKTMDYEQITILYKDLLVRMRFHSLVRAKRLKLIDEFIELSDLGLHTKSMRSLLKFLFLILLFNPTFLFASFYRLIRKRLRVFSFNEMEK